MGGHCSDLQLSDDAENCWKADVVAGALLHTVGQFLCPIHGWQGDRGEVWQEYRLRKWGSSSWASSSSRSWPLEMRAMWARSAQILLESLSKGIFQDYPFKLDVEGVQCVNHSSIVIFHRQRHVRDHRR